MAATCYAVERMCWHPKREGVRRRAKASEGVRRLAKACKGWRTWEVGAKGEAADAVSDVKGGDGGSWQRGHGALKLGGRQSRDGRDGESARDTRHLSEICRRY